MADIALAPTPALGRAPLGAPEGPLRLSALPEGRLIHVLARGTADAAALAARLAPLSDGTEHTVRPYAPGQWFVVADQPLGIGELRRFSEEFGLEAALSDQSHGRVRVALDGPAAPRVLAKGSALDLSDAMFPVGRSAQCLFGHIGIHVTRLAPDRYELIVLRGFAESLWEALEAAGSEFLTGRPAALP